MKSHAKTQLNTPKIKDLSAFRLKKISFEDYRCFDHLTVDLHPNLTVIVGSNGAGKTAILDGIATALAPAVNLLSSANQRLGDDLPADEEQTNLTHRIEDKDFRIIQWGEGRNREFTKRADIARISIETTDSLKWDIWDASIKGKTPSRKIGQKGLQKEMLRLQDSFGSEQREFLPIFAYYGVGRGNFTLPQRLRENRLNYGYPATALHQSLNAVTDMRELLVWFDSEEAAELRQNRYADAGDFQPSPILQAVRAALESLLGTAYRNPRINKERKLVVDAEKGPSPLQVNQLSQGYQSMLALAMDYARRQGIANIELVEQQVDLTPLYSRYFQLLAQFPLLEKMVPDVTDTIEPLQYAPGVVLIDEVDLHLHPAWQQRVLTDLLRVFPLTQFIVTTHSPQVLSTVPAECIRVIQARPDGTATAEPPVARTYGEPSGDVLHSVMAVDPQPPVAEKQDLKRLTELVDQGLYDLPEATQLMQRLTAALGEQHPQLQRLQRSIKRQQVLKG